MGSKVLKRQILTDGIKLFKAYDRCWMDYKITKENPPTFHHVVPVRKGGPTSIENLAILSLTAHLYFNIMEKKDPSIAENINNLFKQLNETMEPPTEEYYMKLHYYMDKYESKRVRIYIK